MGKKDKDGHSYEFFITPFGANKNLYTYNNIVDDEVLVKAKEFYYEYRKTAGLLDAEYKSEPVKDKETEWKIMRKNKDITGETGLFNKNELTQKEFQDKANVWHIMTKLYLTGACSRNYNGDNSEYLAEKRREELFGCINTVMQKLIARIDNARNKNEAPIDSYAYIQYLMEEYEIEHNIPDGEYQMLFANLSKCEHLRWNASNRMLGYRMYEKAERNQKHYLHKTHACMVSNEELIRNEKLRETIKYDYNTILVTLKK